MRNLSFENVNHFSGQFQQHTFSRIKITEQCSNIYFYENKHDPKGQLISKAIFLGFKSPKNQTKVFKGFLP